jgi:hypothetical protein
MPPVLKEEILFFSKPFEVNENIIYQKFWYAEKSVPTGYFIAWNVYITKADGWGCSSVVKHLAACMRP